MIERYEYLEELKRWKDKDLIKINLEDPTFNFNNYMALYNFVNDKIDNEKYYVFLDEVQNVNEFQKAVDGLYLKKMLIYI